ncbi:SRPBCC family protein [Streptomyces sp. SID3212]|uniref:SRPBCC family protein n=1 Tax=unclassified Streptomyces TaxID=2593676 RepID=UPI0013700220|nr:SRPBCC family protein [Streptomyces sp. SID3212]MYV53666.1 cyclase [Streptomyces sp. SID3212]
MSIIEASADIGVPVRMAYNQWTQFETFPRFMDSVVSVERSTATQTHWVTKCGGLTREFDTEVVEQRPDERVAWRSLGRPLHSGAVTFVPLGDEMVRVTMRIEVSPRGILERAGNAMGVVRKRVDQDLANFKEFIEGQGCETGQWRGAITESRVRPDSGQNHPRVPNWPSG